MATLKQSSSSEDNKPKPVKKLVLCFDGTGNTFAGNNGDTNIVKLYHKFDREGDDNQYHYYQPGIGTYDINGGSVNKGFFGRIASSFSKSMDSGFGTSFDAHVIAGYRFIMRYYDSGDKIYIFGFSRGAFTARFLSRMINKVGILSKGNEEMVPFAYQLYQEYEQGKRAHTADEENKVEREEELLESPPSTPGITQSNNIQIPDEIQAERDHITAFKHTFCRRNKEGAANGQGHDVKVHFLGIFDCVSSVAVLENPFGTPKPVQVHGTAHHVRHAVAVDEHRAKFRAALLDQDLVNPKTPEDGKEVWFPGNHGDVGGGWPVMPDSNGSWTEWLKRVWRGHKLDDPEAKVKAEIIIDDADDTDGDDGHAPLISNTKPLVDNDGENKKQLPKTSAPYQMSDIPLAWMIHELEQAEAGEPKESRISWNGQKDAFLKHFDDQKVIDKAVSLQCHDTLQFGGGSAFMKVLFWNFLECLPFLPRWERSLVYKEYQTKKTDDKTGKTVIIDKRKKVWGWIQSKFLPNLRGSRDIPDHAVLHRSLYLRLTQNTLYKPQNNNGDGTAECLTPYKDQTKHELRVVGGAKDPNHTLYVFENSPFKGSMYKQPKAVDIKSPAADNSGPWSSDRGHGQPTTVITNKAVPAVRVASTSVGALAA